MIFGLPMKKIKITCVCGVDSETLIPEATDKNIAVVRSDDEALGMNLDALVQKVSYLPPVCPCAAGCENTGKKKKTTEHMWIKKSYSAVTLGVGGKERRDEIQSM